jgi:hypothetical protein
VSGSHHRWLIVIPSGSCLFGSRYLRIVPVPARRTKAPCIFPFRVICQVSPHFLLNACTLGPKIRTRSEAYCRQGDLPSWLLLLSLPSKNLGIGEKQETPKNLTLVWPLSSVCSQAPKLKPLLRGEKTRNS